MARCPGLLDDLWFMDTGLSNGCQAWQLMKAQNASYFGSPQNIGHMDTVVKENQAIFFTATKHKHQGNNQYFYECWGSASFCTTDMELQYSQTFERSCLKIFTATQRCVYNHDITLVLEKYDSQGKFCSLCNPWPASNIFSLSWCWLGRGRGWELAFVSSVFACLFGRFSWQQGTCFVIMVKVNRFQHISHHISSSDGNWLVHV